MNSKDLQRSCRKIVGVVRSLNTPKCRQNCGRPAVRETHGYGPLCDGCYRNLDVIVNGPRRARTKTGGRRRKSK
jgi:hypothetical protein